MWRAFFFAIGTFLILSGAQCLVIDHFVVANSTRVPGFVAKFLEDRNPSDKSGVNPRPNGLGQSLAGQPQNQPIPNPFQQANFPNNNAGARPFQISPSNNGSRFGPSRFADSQFSNSQLPPAYYGGKPSGFGQTGIQSFQAQPNLAPQIRMAGYGQTTQPSGPIGIGSGQNPKPSNRALRLIKPKDWMPWALLAVGTLVVLYTNSTTRRYSAE